MTIYVIQTGCIHEGGGTRAVFTDKAKASAYAAHLVGRENADQAEGNAMMREDHEPGGRFAEYPFDPLPYYVPVDAQHPVVAEWRAGSDYIAIFAMESDPEVPA